MTSVLKMRNALVLTKASYTRQETKEAENARNGLYSFLYVVSVRCFTSTKAPACLFLGRQSHGKSIGVRYGLPLSRIRL